MFSVIFEGQPGEADGFLAHLKPDEGSLFLGPLETIGL